MKRESEGKKIATQKIVFRERTLGALFDLGLGLFAFENHRKRDILFGGHSGDQIERLEHESTGKEREKKKR